MGKAPLNCQEVTDIDKLTESRVKIKNFVAEHSKPFFLGNALIELIKLCSLKDLHVNYKKHWVVLKVYVLISRKILFFKSHDVIVSLPLFGKFIQSPVNVRSSLPNRATAMNEANNKV